MKILIDITPAVRPDPAGIGNYTRELVSALFRIDPANQYVLGIHPKKYAHRVVVQQLANGRSKFVSLMPLVYPFVRGRIDVFHSLRHRLPRFPGFRKVVTIHDLDTLDTAKYFNHDWAKKRAERMVRIIKQADSIITPSEFTRNRILEEFKLPAEKIRVINHGVSHHVFSPRPQDQIASILAKYKINRPYVLNVSSFNPKKNKVNLVRAFARTKLAKEGALVLAGSKRGNYQEVVEEVERLGLRDSVYFLHYVSRDDIPFIYSGARIFAFPSHYEGFGLPVLEAMASGAPVLAANTSALPEIAQNAAEFCDPNSIDQIAGKLDELWRNEKRLAELKALGYQRAASFHWKKTAEDTLNNYRFIMESQKSASFFGFFGGGAKKIEDVKVG